MNDHSSFRKDIVSGAWVLVASGLKKKPNFFKTDKKRRKTSPKNCPFENPQASGHDKPILSYPVPGKMGRDSGKSSWFLQVILNKFPILTEHKVCPVQVNDGIYQSMHGTGFQELVITRDHNRSLGFMKSEEINLVLTAYLSRFNSLKKDKCVEYILIFHNNGPSAGASVPHPHSQILALPIIPPDVLRSLEGSKQYFQKYKKCIHCSILSKELKDKKRIIYRNEHFVALCPFASHIPFEIRVYPLRHEPNFGNMNLEILQSFSDLTQVLFAKLRNAMNDPDYNFFIHTSPVKNGGFMNYHWHLEIFPRTNIWGGLELGAGIEVVKMPPEEVALIFRKAKAK